MFHTRALRTLSSWAALILIAGVTPMALAQTSLAGLTCEYLTNPIGIDIPQPRLSWTIQADERGQKQTAYQIQVAPTPQDLENGNATLWDSDKVDSDQSIHIPYAGQPLPSRATCYWRVRIWDKDGQPSPWSQTASWTMGLLTPQDWTGNWLAYDPPADQKAQRPDPMNLAEAHWLWFPEGNPIEDAPPGTACFRKTFQIEPANQIQRARVAATADDACTLFINGQKVGETSDWKNAQEFDITKLLQTGPNTIAASAANKTQGPAGFILHLQVDFASGGPLHITTDKTWKTANAEQDKWATPAFDDSAWKDAKQLVRVGRGGPWGAPPVASPWSTQDRPAPLFRKTFDIPKPIQSAHATICGLGYHELHLNGHKVGDHVLDPSFTRYDRRALYVTHDVTTLLSQGPNAIGVILGNGWYNMHTRAVWDFDRAPWRANPRMILDLHIKYQDGSTQTITSDGSWKAGPSPITFDSIRNGEIYDARLEKSGWDTPKFDDSQWIQPAIVDGPAGQLTAQMMPPAKVTKELTPVAINQVAPGIFVADMGQNFSGWIQLHVTGPAGAEIIMRYDERINPGGTVHQANNVYVRSGEFQTDRYILKGGGEEVWEPRFVYHGFQYVQIEGFPGTPTKENIIGRVVHTAFQPAGHFECSSQLLNQIQDCAHWAYLSNFVGYPTDCPHREKNGWTGDAHLAAEQGLLNFASASAYTKWLNDFKDEQKPNGELPGIVPTSGWGYGIGPSWDSAYILIPWYLYTYCGDTRILQDHYEGMTRYIAYMTGRAKDHIYPDGLGDWVPPGGNGRPRKTPVPMTSTGYYYADTAIVAQVAQLLGKTDDAQKYTQLAKDILEAYQAKFYDPDKATYANGHQTALCCPIYHGITPTGDIPGIIDSLLKEIGACGGHLDTGILGTKYLLHVLTDCGHHDTAYAIATNTTYPSWGHWIQQGATTLWENWDGEASRNHIMFGDISHWCYKNLAGIAPDVAQPGFKHIIIRPRPLPGLTYAKAGHQSMYGPIRTNWKHENGQFTLDIAIPPNTTATLYIPNADPRAITESGKPATQAPGVKLIETQGQDTLFNLTSGTYTFQTTL